jgi:general secretion pathway protein B
MSYILEALKKAQAERSHGAIPSVHAQPVVTPPRQAMPGRWLWLAGIAALLAAGAVLLWSVPGKQPVALTAQAPAVPPVAATPAASATPPAPAPAPVATTPSPAPDVARTSPVARPKAPSGPVRKLGEPVPAAAPAPVPAAAAPERIALLQELPPQIQREIPPIAINGYIYASNPAERSVLINNHLRREGDQLADGLTLEKLLPREMVLNYRGYRYRVSY